MKLKVKKLFLLFNPAELTGVAFALFMSIIILLVRGGVSEWVKYFSTNILFIIFVVAVALLCKNRPQSKNLIHVRNWYPMIFSFVAYKELSFLIPLINPNDIDSFLMYLDYRIFGVYPTVWMERILHPFITELLQLAYCSLYFLPLFLGIAIYKTGDRRTFFLVYFATIFSFLFSYIGYILFPALGPRFSAHHLQTKTLVGFIFTIPIRDILNGIESIMWDAFPSGHTMIPLVILYYSWVYKRSLFYIYVPIVALTIFSTVYLRYHHVVDVLAGALLSIVVIVIVELLMKAWEREQKKYRVYPDNLFYNSMGDKGEVASRPG